MVWAAPAPSSGPLPGPVVGGRPAAVCYRQGSATTSAATSTAASRCPVYGRRLSRALARRRPPTLPLWGRTCTCCASGAVDARRSGRVRIERTARVATSASTRSSCSTGTVMAGAVYGHRCLVWWRPRTGSGMCTLRHAVRPVDPRLIRPTGGRSGCPASAAVPRSTLELCVIIDQYFWSRSGALTCVRLR